MAAEQEEVHKGLNGVVADESAVSKVMAESDELTYRGYPVEQLAERCAFEEVAYLLWDGELPTRAQLDDLSAAERGRRALSKELLEVIARFPSGAHPMDALRTGVSFLGLSDADAARPGEPPTRDQALTVLARAPTIVAASHRHARGEEPIAPDEDLSFAASFFWMCFGEVPDEQVVRAFDASLVLYAEHGFNASTFTARTIVSTESDLYSAIVGAIGALKGPLHGGANEAVMEMLREIDEPDRAEEWLDEALSEKRKVMGFGHRVYRNGDSRVPTMRRHLGELAEAGGEAKWVEIADRLERKMNDDKGLFPNVDFPAGPAYHLMGFPTNLFTPIFVIARVAGWAAHILEQAADNALVRPLASYVGEDEREVVPLDERG